MMVCMLCVYGISLELNLEFDVDIWPDLYDRLPKPRSKDQSTPNENWVQFVLCL